MRSIIEDISTMENTDAFHAMRKTKKKYGNALAQMTSKLSKIV